MRYLILLMLNVPIILLAFLDILTRYKMNRISKRRFYYQLLLWIAVLGVVASSFPLYNALRGKPLLDSSDLSAFDIVQTTVIIWLIFIINNLRQKLANIDHRLRDLHQELSIKLKDL